MKAQARPRASTMAWLLVLLGSLAFLLWQALAPAPDDDHDHATHGEVQFLLQDAPLERWGAFDLVTAQSRQRYERDRQGRWFAHADDAGQAADHLHVADEAAAQRIAQVLELFGRTRVERRLAADPSSLGGYGLDAPILSLIVFGVDGRSLLRLEVGAVAPDGLSVYVRAQRLSEVWMIPLYQAQGLVRLASPGAGL